MVTQEANCSSFSEMYTQPAEMVKEYPLSSMMVLFGVGIGVGLILTHSLSEPVSRAIYGNPTMTDRWTRQLHDVLAQVIPDSIARQMHSK